jgi:S1-C subfamily serine protease
MNPSSRTALVSGLIGGLVAVVIGAVLLATNVIHSGETKTVVQQAPVSQPSPNNQESGGLTVADIYKRTSPGVAFIQARVKRATASPFGLPRQDQGIATGSGFVLDKNGYILTNAHVIDQASDVQVSFGRGDPVDAKIVGKDLSTDLAVIKVNPKDTKLTPVPLGDSGKIQVGDPTIAIGNPFGYDDTVTTGIVSAVQRQIDAPNGFSITNVIQTDAAINPGNSGGPLLDGAGRVIGINSQIATGGAGSGSVGIGFAVPVNTAKSILPELKKSGEVEHAFVGVTTTPITKQLAKDLNLPTDKGALVQDVVKGGPADKAGLRAGRTQTGAGIVAGGDLIVAVGGKEIAKPEDVANAIANKKPGEKLTVEYYRGSKKRTAVVTLGKRPNKAAPAPSSPSPLP